MPELPDITVYVEALSPRVVGRVLDRVSVKGPFFVRTFDPPTDAAEGCKVASVGRLGKRVVLHLEGGLALVLHLMIAGRLLWKAPGTKAGGRIDLAALSFGESGTLIVTEASTQKRAGLWIVREPEGPRSLDPGGLDVLTCSIGAFESALIGENRTLKRVLTNPRAFDGIGNAYSDEILHAARLSPVTRTGSLSPEQRQRLFEACRSTLERWIDILRRDFGLAAGGLGRFPGVGEITAFRPHFAVHGKYKKPCPACGDPVQRIVHAENETNYCATCQTGGRVLADRSLSRLLKDDWPRTIEAWEEGFGSM
jgi:formamidopyrimidine-DNA glycosylase